MRENVKHPVVLITGCSGLIGSRVAKELAPDHHIVGLDVRPPDPGVPLEFVECDLTDETRGMAAIRGVGRRYPVVASVLHLAAYYDFSGEPSPLYQKLTIDGTGRLLRGLRAFDRVEQFAFSSSLLVMKPTEPGELLDETSVVRAEWDYPESKLEAEKVVVEARGDIPAVILRIAGVYDEQGHSPPITQQIWRIREKKLESFVFPGRSDHGQSFVHLDDLASCLRKVVEKRASLEDHEVFLIGEPDVMSYEEMQEQIGEHLHGAEWPSIRIPKSVAKAGAWIKEKLPVGEDEQFIKPWMVDLADAHYAVSIDRARERLGWVPGHRLRTSLADMLRELGRDPEAWYRENDLPVGDGRSRAASNQSG